MSLPDWGRAHGTPAFEAAIKTTPADFVVTEDLGVDFSGSGEHDLLYVRKTAANTEWVSRQLASFAGVAARDVGYSGLKDRHAVTSQWFSVPRWNSPDWAQVKIEGVEIVQVERHSRKLHRGTHKANGFRIVLRGAIGDSGAVLATLKQVEEKGVPNYFGPQRFGRNAANLTLADQWSHGNRLPRHKRSLAISAARSYLFNQMLAARVADDSWNRIVPGDTANLDGTRSVFVVESVDKDIVKRCSAMDIHPTAVLWGDGSPKRDIPADHEKWLAALSKARVKPAHRSLRLPVHDLTWEIGRDALELKFVLGRGAFATAVLREIADVADAER